VTGKIRFEPYQPHPGLAGIAEFIESSEKVLFVVILSEGEESNFLIVLDSLGSSLRSE